MNFKKLWDVITETGGATYNPATGDFNPRTGYMVATTKDTEAIFNFPASIEEFQEVVNAFIKARPVYWDLLVSSDDLYLGFWKHEGQLYIDFSQNIESLDYAIGTARLRDQIAIYDCENKKDIHLKF